MNIKMSVEDRFSDELAEHLFQSTVRRWERSGKRDPSFYCFFPLRKSTTGEVYAHAIVVIDTAASVGAVMWGDRRAEFFPELFMVADGQHRTSLRQS